MKKLALALSWVAFLWLISPARAQVAFPNPVRSGGGLPATCQPGGLAPALFVLTSGTPVTSAQVYQCTAVNTWTAVPTSAGASPASPTASVQFNAGGGLFGGDANFTWDNADKSLLVKGKIFAGVTFNGAGLNDLTASYAQTNGGQQCDSAEVTVTAGTPDTFSYTCRTVAQATGVAITGSNQYLGDGLTIHFGATTGHTSTNSWSIEAENSTGGAPTYSLRSLFGAAFFDVTPSVIDIGGAALQVYETYTDLPQPSSGLAGRFFGMEYDGGKMGMTQPLVSFDFLPHSVDSGSVTTAIGPRMADQTVGTTGNCNLIVGSNSDAACPAGDWEIVGATAKPSRLGGSLEAPSITITGSSFSFNGMTCTIVAGAIACS